MIKFRIYDMMTRKGIAYDLKKEQVPLIVKANEGKKIMVIKHDTETKSDEIVDKYTLTSLKNMSCVELKKEITENVKMKTLR